MALALYKDKITPILDQACKVLKLDSFDENPQVKKALQAVPVKPSHILLIVSAVVAVLSLLNIGSSMICNLIGFVYPAYMSFKALETAGGDDDKQWLTYWIVYSLFTVTDGFVNFLLSFVPFYYFIKLAFYVYLFHPRTLGASVIFEKFIRPNLKKYEGQIDSGIDQVKAKLSSATRSEQ